MRKLLNDVKTLAKNEDGVVSFEYVIVAACIVAAVSLAFGVGGAGPISTALSTAISTIAQKVANAVA